MDDILPVCKINELYKNGFVEMIKQYYERSKEDILKSFPFVKKYDEEKLYLYISYYMLTFATEHQAYEILKDLTGKQNYSEEDIKNISECMSDILVSFFVCLYERDLGSDEKTKEDYKTYLAATNKIFAKNDATDKFMKDNYNPIFENTVKSYLLNNNLDIDKIGMSTDGDDYFKNAIYCLYTYLSGAYSVEYKENHKHLKKFFRMLDYDQAMILTKHYLKQANDALYSEEEYMKLRAVHVHIANAIIEVVDSQLNENINSVERELKPKKNNE